MTVIANRAAAVEIIEVSPRDGLQNEPTLLDAATKLELIRRAVATGVSRIEVTSFVNPKRVPQMADADVVAAGLPEALDTRYIGLALNARGFDRAEAAGLDEINYVCAASNTFNRRNQGADTAVTLAEFRALRESRATRADVGITIATAFGCPFEGEVPLDRLLAVVDDCVRASPFEIALADTIGVATPADITTRIDAVRQRHPDMPLRLHLHNTRNTGIANAWAGVQAGVTALDTSLGGTGGCPFAPRATGNIATEDLVYLLDRAGVKTGVDLEHCIEAASWLEAQLGKPLPGMVMKAGGFPTGDTATDT